jgi:hypothetical protein
VDDGLVASSPEASSRESQRSLRVGVALTVAAWVFGRVVVAASWAPARNPLDVSIESWKRLDSYHYFRLAKLGNSFLHCPPGSLPAYLHVTYCGSAGWLPGYPLVLDALHGVGISFNLGAQIVAWPAFGVAIFLVWWGWCRSLGTPHALAVLCLFAVFPGSVYDYAFFPVSLALACIVGAVLAATRERFIVSALLMVIAGLCYPSAWFAAGGLAVGLFLAGLRRTPKEALRRGLWGLIGLGSLPLLCLYDYLTVHRFDAYFAVQNQVGAQIRGRPGHAYLELILKHDLSEQIRAGHFGAVMLAVQGIAAPLLLLAASLVTFVDWRQQLAKLRDLYALSVGLGVTVALILLTNPGAWQRSIALAAPAVPCLRRAPLAAVIVTLMVTATVTALASHVFFALK